MHKNHLRTATYRAFIHPLRFQTTNTIHLVRSELFAVE